MYWISGKPENIPMASLWELNKEVRKGTSRTQPGREHSPTVVIREMAGSGRDWEELCVDPELSLEGRFTDPEHQGLQRAPRLMLQVAIPSHSTLPGIVQKWVFISPFTPTAHL